MEPAKFLNMIFKLNKLQKSLIDLERGSAIYKATVREIVELEYEINQISEFTFSEDFNYGEIEER